MELDKKEILEKAMDKAIQNGWENLWKNVTLTYTTPKGCLLRGQFPIHSIIFSHDFAKAFFPKGWTVYKQGRWQDCDEKQQYMSKSPFVYEKWEYHLQKMILETQPINYLEKFL